MPPLEPVCVTYNIDMDTEFKFYDASPMKLIRRVVGRDAEGNLTSIRANRALFRDWLSTHLDIKWNKHFNRYEEAADGVTIHFDDGSSATGDILVGADGVHSKGIGCFSPPELLYRQLISNSTDSATSPNSTQIEQRPYRHDHRRCRTKQRTI